MSSEGPSDAPSPAPEAETDPQGERDASNLAALVRQRGVVLIGALDRHLPGAAAHAEAVGSYAFAAAVELGYGRSRSELIREVAKLHEVGKVYVPAKALAKPPEELTDEEAQQLERQHEFAAMLVRGAGLPDEVCDWVLQVGARFDGEAGDDSPPAGEAIPLEARIVRVACICDELLSDPELAPVDATAAERRESGVGRLRKRAGADLDPGVVDALAAVIARTASSVS